MSAVPEGFTLPWNTTVTMADVWAAEKAEANRLKASRLHRANRERREQALEHRTAYVTAAGKAAFAGYDEAEHL